MLYPLWVVWPTVPMGHPDEPAIDVLGYVLSYGRGTRLDEKLELKGIATSNNAFAYSGDIDGQFLATASDAFLYLAIDRGRPGTPMAAYGSRYGGPLDPTSTKKIIAYLRGFQRGPAIALDPAPRAGAGCYHKRDHPEDKRKGRHENRPEAESSRLRCRLHDAFALLLVLLLGELDDQNRRLR